MYEYRLGGRNGRRYKLAPSDDMLVVRARAGRRPSESGRRSSRRLMRSLERVAEYRSARVEVLRLHPGARADGPRQVLEALASDRALRFTGRCLLDVRSRRPVVYTENIFVKFREGVKQSSIARTLRKYRLETRRPLDYAAHALFVAAPEGTGRRVFEIAARLLDEHDDIELCHPELIRPRRKKVAYPEQWHLRATTIDGALVDAHASVEAAWEIGRGAGTTIAVIDDGIDVDHVEFRALGGLVAPRDLTQRTDDPRPLYRSDNHGTACAGVALAAGVDGASGVAPEARLMPLRLSSGLGSQDEADAFVWAARNGADVISCSWGPEDGDPAVPGDPLHRQVFPLPDNTRLALEYALAEGRRGLGCVIAWAAGNGNEPVDNDHYASHPGVIAVGACNDRGLRSRYSDYGRALWCCFPSSDDVDALTPGIWTTDRLGAAGYNPGAASLGHLPGDYTNNFGGTSSAAPGVAGLAALILSTRPDLTAAEVKELIGATCDAIDDEHGGYDDDGHSLLYGFGRANALRALEEASSD